MINVKLIQNASAIMINVQLYVQILPVIQRQTVLQQAEQIVNVIRVPRNVLLRHHVQDNVMINVKLIQNVSVKEINVSR